ALGHERLLDEINRVDFPAIHDEVFRERLGELDRGESRLAAGKNGMRHADVHRHDGASVEVSGLAVDGFPAAGGETPWPEPGLLTVHVEPIITAAPKFEALVQPAA